MFWLGVLVGLMVGSCMGVWVMAMCKAGGQADAYSERVMRDGR